jgi:hypothetical protein
MGNNRVELATKDFEVRYCTSVEARALSFNVSKKRTKSLLVKRTSEDLKSSRCSAYPYLIP